MKRGGRPPLSFSWCHPAGHTITEYAYGSILRSIEFRGCMGSMAICIHSHSFPLHIDSHPGGRCQLILVVLPGRYGVCVCVCVCVPGHRRSALPVNMRLSTSPMAASYRASYSLNDKRGRLLPWRATRTDQRSCQPPFGQNGCE